MSRWRVIAVLPALILTAGALAACGGGSGGGGDPGPFVPIVGNGPGNVPPIGGTPPSGSSDTEALSFRIVQQGEQSAITTAQYSVARTDSEYAALWSLHSPPWAPGIGAPVQPPPPVDFGVEFVVAIFLGTRPTGGYSVEPVSVTRVGDVIEVVFDERQPGANCLVTQALTSPFLFLAVSPWSDRSVTFSGQVVVYTCP